MSKVVLESCKSLHKDFRNLPENFDKYSEEFKDLTYDLAEHYAEVIYEGCQLDYYTMTSSEIEHTVNKTYNSLLDAIEGNVESAVSQADAIEGWVKYNSKSSMIYKEAMIIKDIITQWYL